MKAFVILSFFALPAYGMCDSFAKDSAAKFVDMTDFVGEPLTVQTAIRAAREAFGAECFKVDIHESKCREIVSSDPFSNACYLSTDRGYFFVHSDQVSGAWVIWNRWD